MGETFASETFRTERFRPSTLGEILDRTALLYRRNFWVFTGVACLPIGVIFAITALAGVMIFAIPGVRSGDPQVTAIEVAAGVLAFAIVLPIYVAAAVFSYAGMTEAAARVNRGEAITIRGTFAAVKPRFWRYLGFVFLQGLFTGLPAGAAFGVIVVLIAIAAAAGGGSASIAVGFLAVVIGMAALVAVVWLALGFSLGLPACVVENLPAWESLKRSWKLGNGTRGRIFVMYLLVMVISIALSIVAAIPFLIIVALVSWTGAGTANPAALVAAEVIRVVVDFMLQILVAPISALALVLFYYDQRVRKEGFDIEWMMQQAGLSQPESAAQTAPEPGIYKPLAPPDTVEEP
ncbi:MAG TPA: glycerophosphoryl diester phosphodiesterase membrane domain-containing protein [Terracidiphilus sp.]|jgi:hypothetical protein